MQNQAKTYGEKKNMPTIEIIVVTLHRQTVRVATALGHRHPKSRAGHRAPPRLCQTVRDGSALSIVIPSVKRFSTAADLFDKPISLTSKNLSSDFRNTQGGIYTIFLKSSFAVASLLVRYVNEEKAQKERSYKAPTYMCHVSHVLHEFGKLKLVFINTNYHELTMNG